MNKWIKYTSIITILSSAGCSTYVADPEQNFAYLYSNNASELRLDVRVHHEDDVNSVIYFRLNTSDLLYKSSGSGQPFRSAVKLHYRTYSSVSSKQMLDSASTYVRDNSDDPNEDKVLIGKMEMSRDPAKDIVIVVTARDLNRDMQSTTLVKVPASVSLGPQDFLPMAAETNYPLFDDHVEGEKDLKIYCPRASGKELTVAYFDNDPGLPAPVFSLRSEPQDRPTAEIMAQVQVDQQGQFNFTTSSHGLYQFSLSESDPSYTLFILTESYPRVDRVQDMLPPLRYITSTEEFDEITTSDEPRRAVEDLWIDLCGNRDKARGSIKAYYTRVESANRFFTADVEGWRTDRGLVHIIFGTPNVIQKGDRSETWIYGEETSLMSLRFLFVKKDNPFTDNDLHLERDPSLKGAWYRNVESWRNGRVYIN